MADLADVLISATDPDDTARVPLLRQGIVTAVNPLMVQVGAASTAKVCRCLNGYSPTVADVVSVLVIAGDRLVLGDASQTGAPLEIRPWTGTSTYGSLVSPTMTGEEYMMLSSPGGHTFISAFTGQSVYIRAGANDASTQLVVSPSGVTASGNIVAGGSVYAQGNLMITGGTNNWNGGWFMTDATWLRSINNKNVWLGSGWYGTDGGITVGYGGVANTAYKIDATGAPCRFAGGVQSPWVMGTIGDTDTYMDFPTDGAIRWVANGGVAWEVSSALGTLSANGVPIRLKAGNDANYNIRYNGAITGVEINGWAMVRIFMPSTGAAFDHSNDGHLYATNTYIVSSSIKLKENIADLDDERALEIVRGLRPVTFDRIDGARDCVGLIAEWTRDVAPFAVSDNDDEVPGVDYAGFTPVLARALQVVLDRLDALEAQP